MFKRYTQSFTLPALSLGRRAQAHSKFRVRFRNEQFYHSSYYMTDCFLHWKHVPEISWLVDSPRTGSTMLFSPFSDEILSYSVQNVHMTSLFWSEWLFTPKRVERMRNRNYIFNNFYSQIWRVSSVFFVKEGCNSLLGGFPYSVFVFNWHL